MSARLITIQIISGPDAFSSKTSLNKTIPDSIRRAVKIIAFGVLPAITAIAQHRPPYLDLSHPEAVFETNAIRGKIVARDAPGLTPPFEGSFCTSAWLDCKPRFRSTAHGDFYFLPSELKTEDIFLLFSIPGYKSIRIHLHRSPQVATKYLYLAADPGNDVQ